MACSNGASDFTDDKLKEQRHSTIASWRCPSCDHELDCNPDMVGFPAGVKFDPSDKELVEHLESVVNEGGSRAHPLIGDFIPTLHGNDGICYTHPENLPGVTRDGVCKHFFHRTSKAYTSGTRIKRKIQSECDEAGEAQWHKTGKTNPVIVGGRQIGCKKVLVLYINYRKQGGRKPEKTNWVMHQYHLGREEEKDGELVVSKIFYKQTQLRSEKEELASEVMKDMLPECGAAAVEAVDAMIQLQQHQQQSQQADGQSRFTSAKMSHEDQQQQKKVNCRRPCSLEEAMKAFRTSTEDVQEPSFQPKEIQRPHQHWPPDHHQD